MFLCVLHSDLVFVCLPALSWECWEDSQQVLNRKAEHPTFSQADDDEEKNKRREAVSCGFSYLTARCDTAPVAVAGFTPLITGFLSCVCGCCPAKCACIDFLIRLA